MNDCVAACGDIRSAPETMARSAKESIYQSATAQHVTVMLMLVQHAKTAQENGMAISRRP